MALWTRLKQLVEGSGLDGREPHRLREEEERLAAAALLVHATLVDGEVAPEEKRALKSLLERRFALTPAETSELIGDAKAREQDAVGLYGFTSVLRRTLDAEGRAHMVEMLWEVAMADGVVHEFEANLVWRAAELLGVSTRERVRLRKLVESRQADAGRHG